MSAAEAIHAGLARMDGGRRWAKSGTGSSASVMAGNDRCILGHVQGDYELTPAVLVLSDIGREQYPERCGATIPSVAIAFFNDHPDTTWEDVERVMEKAILRAEEMGL